MPPEYVVSKSYEKQGFTTQNIRNGDLQATEIMLVSLQYKSSVI